MKQLKFWKKRSQGEMKLEKPGKRKYKKMIIPAVLALVVLIVAVKAMMPKEVALPQVETYTVGRGDIAETLDTTGVMQTEEMKTYFSPVGAVVEKCDVKLGEYVTAGQKLASFRLTDLEEEYQEAQLNFDSTMASYREAMAEGGKNASKYQTNAQSAAILQRQVDQKEAEVDALKASLDNLSKDATKKSADDANWMNNRRNELTDENTKVDKEKTEKSLDLQRKQNELTEIQRQLSEKESVSANQTAADIASLNQRKAELEKDIDQLNERLSKLNIRQIEISGELSKLSTGEDGDRQVAQADLQSRYEKASSELAELKSDLAEAEGKRDSAEAGIMSGETRNKLQISNNLSQLSAMTVKERIDMAKGGILAEFSGIITDVKVTEGSLASAGTEMFTISNAQNVSVEVSVNKNDLEKVRVGQKAVVTSVGNTYQGTVERISHTATMNSQNVPVVSAFIHIDNPDENIYLGMEAKALISLDSAEDVLLIPSEALNEGKDGPFCYVLENGVVAVRLITMGLSTDDYIEVTGGLKEGDQVIPVLPQGLVEGSQAETIGFGQMEGMDGQPAEAPETEDGQSEGAQETSANQQETSLGAEVVSRVQSEKQQRTVQAPGGFPDTLVAGNFPRFRGLGREVAEL